MNWVATGITDRGLRRERNEDAFRLRPGLGLFLVADGMGGHAAGEVASGMAADTVEREIETGLAGAAECTVVRQAVADAHRSILERAAREPEKAGMGTTLTAVLLLPEENAACIAHVGDSRVYRLRSGALTRLTRDHTWVQAQIDSGRLSPAEARAHPLSSILTRALGTPTDDLEIDVLRTDVVPGDLLLLCTDGLSGMIEDADIRAILDRPLPLDTIAARLVEAAKLRGGLDNITVVLIRVTE